MTQNHLIVFILIVSQVVNSLWTRNVIFPIFLWVWYCVKTSQVESQQMSFFVFISFHRLSFCIHCLSCSLHVAFISLHFAFIAFPFVSMSFHIPSLCVKHTGLQKLICSNRSGVYLPKRSGFLICRYRFCYRLAIVLGACVGCHLQVSWACPCISTLSFFFSYRVLGRQCVGSVKLQNKLKWNARGYYTIPN